MCREGGNGKGHPCDCRRMQQPPATDEHRFGRAECHDRLPPVEPLMRSSEYEPSALNPRTMKMMARPGMTVAHHAAEEASRASAIMRPHVIVLPGTPSPRKLRAAS